MQACLELGVFPRDEGVAAYLTSPGADETNAMGWCYLTEWSCAMTVGSVVDVPWAISLRQPYDTASGHAVNHLAVFPHEQKLGRITPDVVQHMIELHVRRSTGMIRGI